MSAFCSNFAQIYCMKRWSGYILLIALICAIGAHAERNNIHAIADRPGMGTGTNVLAFGFIQWESGLEVAHSERTHTLTVPTTLFRFGLGPWAELRFEYTGKLAIEDHAQERTQATVSFTPEPLWIGSKIRLWQGSDEQKLKWIPRMSLLLNAGLPLTRDDAKSHPFSGTIDLLFENDLAEWLTLGYDLGIRWEDWAPTPNIFASLAFNFMPTEKFGVFVESYNTFDPDAFDANEPKQTFTVYDINLDFGVTYMVLPRVQLDAYAGFNIYHTKRMLSGPQNNVLFGMGVTWLLYAN